MGVKRVFQSAAAAGCLPVTLALAGTLAAWPAHSQESEPGARAIEEVVVTARRRTETIQDVPIAITAFSGDELEAAGAQDITYLNQVTPNVTLERTRSTNSTLSAFIRGVGQQDPVAGFEPGVGIYLDDVYLNRPQGAVLDIYDVERVEVLRGPQGTLYGRNTIGGAVKYVTRRLGPEPEARVRIATGSYDQLDVVGTFGLPVTDNLTIGGSVAQFQRDGFGENLVQQGVENYNKDVRAARLSIEFTPSDAWFMRLSGDYTEDDSDARNGHRLIPGQFTPGAFPVLDDVFDTRADLDYPETESISKGATALVEWQVNDRLMIKNILAYRENETGQQIDFDSLPVNDLQGPYFTGDDQTSEELQILWSGTGLEALLGFYYLDASAYNEFDVLLGQTGDLIGLPGLNAYTFGEVDTETWSVFADVTLALDTLLGEYWRGLELSVGGRYTDDERSARILRQTFIGGSTEAFGGNPTLIDTTSDFNDSETFTDFTPRVSLSWHASEDHTAYLSWAEGFKGGSFDPRGATTATPDLDNDGTVSDAEVRDFMMFEPEEITTYEVGLKSSWLDGRATTRLAVFDSAYEDVQIPGSIGVDTDGDGIADSFAGVTTNAGKASMTGLEFEGSTLLAADLGAGGSLSAAWTFGWIDAEYDEYIIAVTEGGETSLQDVSDQRDVQNTPEYTGSLSLTYAMPLTLLDRHGELAIVPLASYRDDTRQFEFVSPLDESSYWLYDLSITWTSDDGRVRAGLHGRNLSDKEYRTSGYDFLNIPNPLGLEGTVTAFYGDPRTFSGSIEVRF